MALTSSTHRTLERSALREARPAPSCVQQLLSSRSQPGRRWHRGRGLGRQACGHGGGNSLALSEQPGDFSRPWLQCTVAVRQTGATKALPAESNSAGWTDVVANRDCPGWPWMQEKVTLHPNGIQRCLADVQRHVLDDLLAGALRRASANSGPCMRQNRC